MSDRLAVEENVDLGVLPVEAVLFVADLADHGGGAACSGTRG